jgi:preprotein translocase subunit SecA
MRLFENLWRSIDERVTDVVYRVEQMPQSFISNTFSGQKATRGAVAAPVANNTEIGRQQQQAIENSQNLEKVVEQVRYRGEKPGRNDPCYCGSGKKYKACCLRKDEQGEAA